MADQFGVLPGGRQTTSDGETTNNNTTQDVSSFNLDDLCNNPQLSKIMGMMGKLNNVNTPDEIEKLKNEVDSFLQNEMNVDMDKINDFLPSAPKANQDITYS